MKFFILFSLLFLLSCSESKLPKYTELGELRILALVANTPEVDAGSTVTITPVVSDFTSTSLTFSAAACLDLGVAYGSEPNCDSNPSRQVIATNQAVTTLNAAKHLTGAADPFNVTVPVSTVTFAGRSTQEQTNGVAYLVDFTITNDLGKSVRALKRILVSTKPGAQKNQPPTINAVLLNGNSLALTQALSALPQSEVPAQVTFTTNPETYSLLYEDGSQATKTEVFTTTWFITDGRMKYYRTEDTTENKYYGPESVPTRDAFIITVVRDGRGGETFRRTCFGACP